MSNVIDFEKAKRRMKEKMEHECIDTHEAVLDLSDVVLVEDHFHNVTVTDDSIVIHTIGETKEES
jgi:hypothetical protein